MHTKERECLRRPVGLRRRRGKIRLEARAKGGDYERKDNEFIVSVARRMLFVQGNGPGHFIPRRGRGWRMETERLQEIIFGSGNVSWFEAHFRVVFGRADVTAEDGMGKWNSDW